MPRKKTEIENPPVAKGINPRDSKGVNEEHMLVSEVEEKSKCHIHDKVKEWEVEDIRKNVCVNDEPLTEFEGKHYCLFHLPTKEKDTPKFKQIFRARLNAVEEKLAKIEILPEDEQEAAKNEVRYDFRYVWFPSEVLLGDYKFAAVANFSKATFSAVADFSSATFSANANFSSTTFSTVADFSKATFSAEVNFREATFSAVAYFRSATFSAVAYFSVATFEEKSQILFKETKFLGYLSFYSTNFKGYVEFEGKQDNRLFIGGNALLDLQNARINDAKKISFHTIRLEPSWFVNTDASGFIFTDCKLEYGNEKDLDVKTELENLKKRGFENPFKLLTKACWQLSGNHEEMKSFPKASLLRQMAQESKRLEDNNGWKVWSLHWWYWVSSFYGESPLRAGLVLVGILLLFAVAFMFTDFQVCPIVKTIPETVCEPRTLNIWESALQSLAIATFQSIEYIKPNSKITTFLIISEKILAPLQAALLALAIRRKFMR